MKRFASAFAWYAGNADRFIPATEANLEKTATQACPIRLWLGHLKLRSLSNEVLTAIAKTCSRDAIDVFEFNDGYLFVTPSDRAPPWTKSRTTCSGVMDKLQVRQKLTAQ